MGEIEIAGPGPHDGMRLQVPDEVVALVTITHRDGEYVATWSRRRHADIDEQQISNALGRLLLNAGWQL